MGQTCCGTKPDDNELNYHKTQNAKGEARTFDPETTQNQATVTIQRYFKGMITRRIVKEQYGFEAKHTQLYQPYAP